MLDLDLDIADTYTRRYTPPDKIPKEILGLLSTVKQ